MYTRKHYKDAGLTEIDKLFKTTHLLSTLLFSRHQPVLKLIGSVSDRTFSFIYGLVSGLRIFGQAYGVCYNKCISIPNPPFREREKQYILLFLAMFFYYFHGKQVI